MMVCMVLNSALLLLVRGFGVALLLLMGGRYFAWYWTCDMGLYFVQKIARNDFWHWMPVDGGAGILISVVMRLCSKVAADYTGILQLRLAGELGGAYFTANLLGAFVFCFLATWAYFNDSSGSDSSSVQTLASNSTSNSTSIGNELKEESVWWFVCSVSVAWLLTFGAILLQMKKEYRKSFFSLETGRDWIVSIFSDENPDEVKQRIMTKNRNLWKSIENDVKDWVQSNWWKWKDSRPSWFTDAWIARVPVDFIPRDEDRKLLEIARRRQQPIADKVRLKLDTIRPRVNLKTIRRGVNLETIRRGVKSDTLRLGAKVEAVS